MQEALWHGSIMCGIWAWIKEVESGHSLREGDGQAGQTAHSSSLDNPELFQEESPKKINRLVASRWTDNLCFPEKRPERALWDRVLRDRKVPECVTGGGCGSPWGGGFSSPWPCHTPGAGRSPCDSDGKWGLGVPSNSGPLNLIRGLSAQNSPGMVGSLFFTLPNFSQASCLPASVY